mmetsp:Transcript_38889/g.58686  ORF Transcript_38889/g.58686 Transcript_38889/m.58686 type:complete len:134 (+) Transcript_38889:337-738(+)
MFAISLGAAGLAPDPAAPHEEGCIFQRYQTPNILGPHDIYTFARTSISLCRDGQNAWLQEVWGLLYSQYRGKMEHSLMELPCGSSDLDCFPLAGGSEGGILYSVQLSDVPNSHVHAPKSTLSWPALLANSPEV